MSELERLNVFPYGKVTDTYSWNTAEVNFFNGSTQKIRKKIHPKRSITFTVNGSLTTMKYLEEFYDSHHGALDKFIFVYNGVAETCNFADKLSITKNRECQREVGFSAQISLVVDNSKEPYQPMPEVKVFAFPIQGKIEEDIDWNTNVLDTLFVERQQTWVQPQRTFSFKMSGSVKERDKLVAMYKLYGDFAPFAFSTNANDYYCYFPSELEITDIREGQKVVGYECQMVLKSTNAVVDTIAFKSSYGVVLGKENSLSVRDFAATILVEDRGSVEFEEIRPILVGVPHEAKITAQLNAILLGRGFDNVVCTSGNEES